MWVGAVSEGHACLLVGSWLVGWLVGMMKARHDKRMCRVFSHAFLVLGH